MVSITLMRTITIIIITYNSSKYIPSCLGSIKRYYEKKLEEKDLEVILLDNNSTDDTLKTVIKEKNRFSKDAQLGIRIVENKENLGFANGVNEAFLKANSEFVLLLNPDAEFENNALFSAIAYLKDHPEYAVLGAKILDSHGNGEPSTGMIYTPLPFLAMLSGTEEFFRVRTSPQKITRTGFVSGGCMLLRSSEFRKLGGFDKNLFMYMEDMEYCLRLKKKGLFVVFYPALIVSHASHGSSGRPYAIASIYKGVLYIYKKHMDYLAGIVKLLLMVKAYILVFTGRISNNEYLVSAYEKAISEIT